MSVVIVGGNERMVRQYKELCRSYNCSARVFTNMNAGLKNMGSPLKDSINAALAEIMASEEYQALLDKYFGA